MRTPIAVAAAVIATAGCTDPSPQPQPNEMEVVNATRVDPGVAPGALGNETVNYPEGSITPAEQNEMGNAIRSQETPSSGNAQQ